MSQSFLIEAVLLGDQPSAMGRSLSAWVSLHLDMKRKDRLSCPAPCGATVALYVECEWLLCQCGADAGPGASGVGP